MSTVILTAACPNIQTSGRRSVHVRAGIPGDLRPLREFGLDESAERLGRAADALETEAGNTLLDIGKLQGLRDLIAQLADDRRRGSRWRHDAVPCRDVETGDAGFGNARHL